MAEHRPALADQSLSRRDVLSRTVTSAGLLGLGAVLGWRLPAKAQAEDLVWQIDPSLCIQCGRCATSCVLKPSAARCFHEAVICGYCDLCTGYFQPDAPRLTTSAENQLCPTGAIERRWIEGEYFEFKIKRELCVGCARCVKGCGAYGNGSLFMQIDRSACVDCNHCSIARDCPSQAIGRIPLRQAYLRRERPRGS